MPKSRKGRWHLVILALASCPRQQPEMDSSAAQPSTPSLSGCEQQPSVRFLGHNPSPKVLGAPEGPHLDNQAPDKLVAGNYPACALYHAS